MLIIYLAVLITALYYVSKMLLPEMITPSLAQAIPQPKTVPQVKTIPVTQSIDIPESDNTKDKLETLITEKNKNISILQTELRIYQIQVRESEKVKSLLEDEIHRLREQNRIFRSELGLPTVAQPKENLIV